MEELRVAAWVAVVRLAELAARVLLEDDVRWEAAARGGGARRVAHARTRRVGHKLRRVEIVDLGVLADEPREVMVVVRVVDGHRLVHAAALRKAREAATAAAAEAAATAAGVAVVRHLVDLVAGDCHHLASESFHQRRGQRNRRVSRPVHLAVACLHLAVDVKMLNGATHVLLKVGRVWPFGASGWVGDFVRHAAVVEEAEREHADEEHGRGPGRPAEPSAGRRGLAGLPPPAVD